MRDVFKHRLKGLLVFVVMGLLAFGIFYGAYHGPWDQRFREDMASRNWVYERPRLPAVQKDRIILALDEPVRFKGYKFVYRGLDQGRIRLAVYIMDLDPESAYLHVVPVREARQGLRLAGETFRLITCRSTMLILGLTPHK